MIPDDSLQNKGLRYLLSTCKSFPGLVTKDKISNQIIDNKRNFFGNKDIDGIVIGSLKKEDIRSLRLGCKELSIYPVIFHRLVVPIDIECVKKDKKKWDFVLKNKILTKLIIVNHKALSIFYHLLCSKKIGKDFWIKKLNTIEALQIPFFVEKIILEAILSKINSEVFNNLKKIYIMQSNLMDLPIPKSIEKIECLWANEVYICGLYLKAIIFDCVTDNSFQIKNLPNLESLIIRMLSINIIMKIAEVPNLKEIEVNGERILVDQSKNEILISSNTGYGSFAKAKLLPN